MRTEQARRPSRRTYSPRARFRGSAGDVRQVIDLTYTIRRCSLEHQEQRRQEQARQDGREEARWAEDVTASTR